MSATDRPVILMRDCDAILIPSGEKIRLSAGAQLRVTQSLGGSFTVLTDRGYMARIAGRDADALGIKSPLARPIGSSAKPEEPGAIEKLVWEQLRTCFDPEIPVNIVELGLVYRCQVIPLSEGGNRVEVRFTLTAPGCGMGQVLLEDIRAKISGVPGVREVDVELIWDPPWDQSRISREAKIELGIL